MVSSLVLKLIQYGVLIAMGIVIYSVLAREIKKLSKPKKPTLEQGIEEDLNAIER